MSWLQSAGGGVSSAHCEALGRGMTVENGALPVRDRQPEGGMPQYNQKLQTVEMPMPIFTMFFDGGWVKLSAIRFENPGALNADDASWIVCQLEFKIEDMRGGHRISVMTADIVSFKNSLPTALETSGISAVFDCTEDDVRLDVTVGRRGEAKISGNINANHIARYSIDFEATSDQTYVRQCLSDVERFLGLPQAEWSNG